ncbi:MAG: preprotein translocase subunit YajC [Calditrichaeota bacterium]|nr:preprotein translocase subunit YajC [Calditrichota bacterium]
MDGLIQFMPFIIIFLIMYFLMIRPQQKKQKELEKLRSELKSGDPVITSGGIHGKVSAIDDATKTVKIKIDGNTTMVVERSSIVTVNKN